MKKSKYEKSKSVLEDIDDEMVRKLSVKKQPEQKPKFEPGGKYGDIANTIKNALNFGPGGLEFDNDSNDESESQSESSSDCSSESDDY